MKKPAKGPIALEEGGPGNRKAPRWVTVEGFGIKGWRQQSPIPNRLDFGEKGWVWEGEEERGDP